MFQRVNELLRQAILNEQYERLETEAAIFFAATDTGSRRGTRAFEEAALRTFGRG